MKRVGYITDKDGRRITLLAAMGDYGNVQKAYNKARKCKRHRKDVLIFTKDKEENLDKVREDILNLAYEPVSYTHLPRVIETVPRLVSGLGEIVEQLATYIPQVIQELLPPLMSGVQDLLNTLVGMLPEMISIIGQIIPTIIDTLLTILPQLLEAGVQIITELAQGIAQALPTLLPTIVTVVTNIVTMLIENIPLLITAALQPVSYTHLDVYKRQHKHHAYRALRMLFWRYIVICVYFQIRQHEYSA